MMKNLTKRFLAGAILSTTAWLSVQAQENAAGSYGFINLQGGAQATFTGHGNLGDLVTPVGAVSIGGYMNPVVGMRAGIMGWRGKEGVRHLGKIYDFEFMTVSVDMLFNLTNLFSKTKEHRTNLVLLGGVGVSHPKGKEELAELTPNGGDTGFNGRIGLQLDVNLTKHWSVNAEVDANRIFQRAYFGTDHSKHWQVAAFVGVAYKFGKGKRNVADIGSATGMNDYFDGQNAIGAHDKGAKAAGSSETEQVKAPVVKKEEPAPTKKKEVKQAAKPQLVKMDDGHIFFSINSADISSSDMRELKKVADWAAAHPAAKITVTGYADKETGNTQINKAISLRRANRVAEVLQKYGLQKSRMEVIARGDTEQPFAANNKNRVVIVAGSEK